ncbi:MAG: hypothetical protein RBT76_00075 [candidate division Zixibacteria bacterium]|jgi:hypothetical protein|nr:hypothetical protein [candidate division Zixibacteria bacterium]
MRFLIDFFDYIFFRSLLFFEKSGFAMPPVDNAASWVGIIQLGIVFNLALLPKGLELVERSNDAVRLLFISPMYNFVRYHLKSISQDDFAVFRDRWSSESPTTRKIRGWLIATAPISLVLLAYVITLIFFEPRFWPNTGGYG